MQCCHVERSETSLIVFETHAQSRLLGVHSHEQKLHDVVHRDHKQYQPPFVPTPARKHGGFTNRYHLNRLVWLEHFRNISDAIACEKKLKGWRRRRKIALVEQTNPRWLDLSDDGEQQPNVYDCPCKIQELI